VRAPVPSQYPLTPDYSPTATPVGAILQSLPNHHFRKSSPPTSILKRPSGYYSSLPSPPTTPNTPSILSRSSSRGSFQVTAPEHLAPTIRIRNSSPHIPSPKVHNVHRPTSSDSCSTPTYAVSSDRADHELEKQAFLHPEVPTFFEAYHSETRDEALPPSPDSDSHGVQWGYAV
jgi:hypothetical protein